MMEIKLSMMGVIHAYALALRNASLVKQASVLRVSQDGNQLSWFV